MTLGACNIVSDIEPDIHDTIFDIEYHPTFDIVYDIDIRYRHVLYRYRSCSTSISGTLRLTFDIEVSTYTISKVVIFDIEYLRYRYTISNAQTFDIECTYDIEDFDIECDVRYRRFKFDTRYRGAKDLDARCTRRTAGVPP